MKLWIFWAGVALVVIVMYRDRIRQDILFARSDFKKWAYRKWKDWGEPLLVAAILAIVIRTFVVGPYKIPSGSMKPTFMEEDKIFVDKISYRFREPARGDIIVFKYPLDRKKDFVKRLAGLPGDTIEIRDGRLHVNGKAMTEPPFGKYRYYNVESWEYGQSDRLIKVPDGYFFTLGDNSAHSADSRQWGFVPRKDVVGKAVLIWWPPKRVRIAK
ncbi:MAG: Signal peptidase I P [Candidatus Omnitrophica bacterium ADurb.Bin277]|nr:MAG: Signal peptidase I P [Candidatus Omnitrophica bacterium ADurb.Bin277]